MLFVGEIFCLFSGTFEEEAPGGVTRYFVLLSVFGTPFYLSKPNHNIGSVNKC